MSCGLIKAMRLCCGFSICLLMPLAVIAADAGMLSEEAFAQCVAGLQGKAREQGISTETINTSLAGVSFVPRVIELDRRQPEFTETFANYFNRRVTDQRVEQGRALLDTHRELLDEVAEKYGVPAQYLVSFWGLETNYGSYFGRMPVLDSLATLACDGRRSTYFTAELMSALKILDEGAITVDRMKGSWAGAMGHVQFMPDVFLRYAVDGDGDGRRDLWNSLPDAMYSAGNFLRGLGWESGSRWGREVHLPDGFDYHKAGRANKKSLVEWRQMGVRNADGGPLPEADIQAALLVPAGHQGPKFLVYDNFDVIMRWNRSEFYALAVGHLADRIAGAGRLRQPPPDNAVRLSRDQVIELQQTLNKKGFDAGSADGIPGPATRAAISRFQRANNMVADGFASREVLTRLGISISH